MTRFRIEIFGGPRNLPTTTAVRAADKLISCLRLPSLRPLLLDSRLVALAAAGPRKCILTRFHVCRMWRLTFRRRHFSDLHTLNDLRDTSAALCRDEGSSAKPPVVVRKWYLSYLARTSQRRVAEIYRNSMLLLLWREHDWRSGWEWILIYVPLVTVHCEFRLRWESWTVRIDRMCMYLHIDLVHIMISVRCVKRIVIWIRRCCYAIEQIFTSANLIWGVW